MSGAHPTLWDLPAFRQGVYVAGGLLALIAVSLINYRIWGAWRWILYGGMLAALLLVAFAGRALFGAHSWFDLRVFVLQPSEFCKIVLIIVLARYFADHEAQVK